MHSIIPPVDIFKALEYTDVLAGTLGATLHPIDQEMALAYIVLGKNYASLLQKKNKKAARWCSG